MNESPYAQFFTRASRHQGIINGAAIAASERKGGLTIEKCKVCGKDEAFIEKSDQMGRPFMEYLGHVPERPKRVRGDEPSRRGNLESSVCNPSSAPAFGQR